MHNLQLYKHNISPPGGQKIITLHEDKNVERSLNRKIISEKNSMYLFNSGDNY